MKSKLDLLSPSVLKTFDTRREDMATQFNTHHGAKWKEFPVGAQVYFQLHQNNSEWKWSPGIVLNRIGPVNYEIELDSGRTVKAHANQVKIRNSPADLGDNLDSFDLASEDEPDPVTPQYFDALDNKSECSEVFEDAVTEVVPAEPRLYQPDPPTPRRSARSNFGIPARRFHDEFNI